MKQALGQPVEGEDFFDRKAERAKAWRKLETSSLLMLAPRRVGKTSLMLALKAEADQKGFESIDCSFAACHDELDCVNQLLKAVARKQPQKSAVVTHVLKSLGDKLKAFKRIKLVGVQFELSETDRNLWREAGEAFTAALVEAERPWLICVDEVPVFLIKLLENDSGRQRVSGFLNWFRDLRQQHHAKVRWVIAGSIGMDTLTARYRLGDTINDLYPFPLGAFDEATADQFLCALAQSYRINLSEPVRKAVIQRIGWPLPYYLQLMFDQLLENADTGKELQIQDVDRAFEALLSPTYKVHFDYWRQRLHEELAAVDADHAIAMLNHACQDPNGITDDTLSQILAQRIADEAEQVERLRYLLEVLESDGYLYLSSGRWRFRLAWLREYWQRRVAP